MNSGFPPLIGFSWVSAESAAPWVSPRTEKIRHLALPPGGPWDVGRGWGAPGRSRGVSPNATKISRIW
jgi:hypothetical protein